ncbi:MAG: hypothetical protein EOP56_07165 [Sphingobacteriales bacterium]|nr:MAG: hypothetical protein EOP56_07165 [Sphingobacteriales bacterium]
MRIVLLIVLLLSTITATARPPERWYKVMATGSGMWDSSYNIFIRSMPGSDSITLTGFTNHGATVRGTVSKGRIMIPKQTVTIMHMGGSFTSVAEAEGSITDSLIVMQFYYKQGDYGHTAGRITAIRWSNEVDSANRQHESQAAKALHASRTRDTVIDGERYRWIVYDEKHMMIEIGQSNDSGIKNGRWLYTDDYGRLDNIHQYIDGVLNGWTTSYSYTEYDLQHRFFCMRFYTKKRYIHRSQGLYVNDRHVGKWTQDEARNRRRKKWKTVSFDLYDLDGHITSKARTYPNGKPYMETFYTREGAVVWYIIYDKRGKIMSEGLHQPPVMLGW